jgi:HK97 family phage major capsid protein
MMQNMHIEFDTLTQAFQEYKSANDARVHELETKGNINASLLDKLNQLNQSSEKRMEQLQKLDIALRRPNFESSTHSPSYLDLEQKAAFLNYVRSGENNDRETKTLSTLNNQEGGYLIPQVVADRIGQDLHAHSPLRRLANVMQITSSSVDLLLDKKGAEVGWVGETEERGQTGTPEVQKLNIPVHELYAKPRATQKLLDDARINVEAWLAQAIAVKMAQAEHLTFLLGDGNKKPKGILRYQTVPQNAWEWGKIEHVQVAGETITMDDLINLMSALKPDLLSQACWLMSRSALAEIRKLKSEDGDYLWQPSIGESFKSSLFGYPVEIADDMPGYKKNEASTPVIFGNFKVGYQIVDRSGIHVLRDPFTAKPYVEFYTTKRVGGDVVQFDAIKVLKYGQ